MNKKVLFIGLGVLALGAAYYFWNKSKEQSESTEGFENAEGKKKKKSFCQQNPDHYTCRSKAAGKDTLLAK